MNVSQDKPSIRFVSQADFVSEVLQSGKSVLAVFTAPWSRPRQVLEATLNEVVPACDGRVQVVKINADDNPGRTPLIV
jgi:thioredoxin 1